MKPIDAINAAIAYLGGPVAAAATLGVGSYQVVQGWRRNGVPDEKCPLLEWAVDGTVTCEQLRPDVPWTRVKDRSWPHAKGRPAADFARELA